ncbi:MAG: NEW3 domain-containing protein [Sphingobacterium composti]|uniref:COG1470 family protein n=1 Tax=Sphingobacterium composti TaxID=363260 RepID=UPI00135CD6B8|nr:NEW3 domain-containing protein [Sphingobacterium composti Ten et al. 2007 non Yoo et al. 2007]
MLKQLLNLKKCQNLSKGLFLNVFLLFFSFHVFGQNANNKTSFTARLLNVEAPTNETFRYNSTLTNGNTELTNYNLSAKLPAGWQITYRVEGVAVTSLQIEPGISKDIGIEINCPISTKPDTYKIPVEAISQSDTLKLGLEAVVRGSYAVEISTPTGRLSDEIVAGNSKELLLVVKNSGTLPLNTLELTSQLPSKWETSFSPSTIEQLQPGQQVDLKVTLKVPEKTIAGDYITKMNVKSTNASTETSIRIMVKTSILSGWVGILIIIAAAGLIYYLIRKYGRR